MQRPNNPMEPTRPAAAKRGPRNPEELQRTFREDLRKQPPDPFELWPVIEKASGSLVGHSGLLDKEVEGQQEVDLVYVFVPAVWGNGYATEVGRALMQYAFEQMSLKRLICLIELENEVSGPRGPAARYALRGFGSPAGRSDSSAARSLQRWA